MNNREWKIESGEQRMGMENKEWRTENGEQKMDERMNVNGE